MRVILDWDHTLFNTRQFKKDLAKQLIAVGLPKKVFFETYEMAVKKDNGRYDYNYLDHIRIIKTRYGLGPKQAEQLKRGFLRVMRRGSSYLFPETKLFLKFLKRHAARIVLCTWGNASLQRMKVYSSGVQKYFSKIVLTPTKKYTVVRPIIKVGGGEKVYFVSDNINELKEIIRRFSSVKPILKIRADRREAAKEARRLHVPAFSSLIKIYKLLVEDNL